MVANMSTLPLHFEACIANLNFNEAFCVMAPSAIALCAVALIFLAAAADGRDRHSEMMTFVRALSASDLKSMKKVSIISVAPSVR